MSMKLMLHFWWNLRVSVFWTAAQQLRLVALRALKLCSPRVMNTILVFQRLIHLEVDHSTLEMVLHQKLLPCPDSQSGMMLLVISGFVCICGSAETDAVDAGNGFSQGTALRHRLWQRLDSIPNAVCWWPLFVSSRGLYSMPLCGQHEEPSSLEH